jgi:hypothetical protein
MPPSHIAPFHHSTNSTLMIYIFAC